MLATAAMNPRERFHPRVESDLMVKVVISGRSVLTKANDLSMNGIYLAGDPTLGRDRFQVVVPLPNDREVVTECRVCRRDADGVAVEFDRLDWEDLFALARYLHPRLP